MRYYLVDDDINIVKILENIIEENDLGEVIGKSNDGETALKEILAHNPDIVLVDLLMPILDGNSLVKEIKALKPWINMVMISQVSDEGLISDSYNSGIEFFISKPINRIAVEKVLRKVAEKIQLENMLSEIQKVFKGSSHGKNHGECRTKELKYALSMLGILGEKGTKDIIKVCEYLYEKNSSFDECNIEEICRFVGDTPQTVKQRIRRAIKSGLTNIANIGIEDYYNEIFTSYSNILFDFENVKAEMDYLRKKRKTGGKVNINKFLEGLLLLCEK